MHVKSRLMAFGGLALALCILFMVLGSIFETGTLFFLAASSFFVGIVIRESGMKMGLAFYMAAVLLGFILAPNKFYVITFGAMGLYILVIEGVWRCAEEGCSGESSTWSSMSCTSLRCCSFRSSSFPGRCRRRSLWASSRRGRQDCGSTTTPTNIPRPTSGAGCGAGCSGWESECV